MTEQTNDTASVPNVPAAILSEPVELDTPIRRGAQEIAAVQIRKPNSGELRGLNLVDLGQMHVDSLIKVLPRLTVPAITPIEAAQMNPADLLACGAEVASFLLTKRARQEASLPA